MANLTKIGPDSRPIGETPVCVFHRATIPGRNDEPIERRGKGYLRDANQMQILTLAEFLQLGSEFREEIQRIRSSADKAERSRLKKSTLPAGCISCRVKTRLAGIRKEDKILQYNSLIVLDFDNLEDVEAAKQDLAQLSFFWYLGLSVSGKGLFGIVPVATTDWREHKHYFDALSRELADIGYTVDGACSDETRLRFISIDEHPYLNESCDIYCLPEDDPEELQEDFQTHDIPDETRLEMYVEEWERKKIPLDDYNEWLTLGMSLSGLGDAGRAAFHRISAFSGKYDAAATDKKFDELARNTRAIGPGSFFYRCHQRGVIPESIPHYECIPFPVEVFPKKVREIILETHKHQNFPIDYIAPCLLFVAALSCGNAAVVEMQMGWKEKPLLYLAIVGGRGTNKTSCFDFALAPIREKDDQEYERYVSEKALYDAEFLKPLKERNPKLEMPMYQQYILSDFTPEVLVRQHKANPRGLIVFFDELIGFIYSFNKYRSGADEQMWTQLFAGGGVTVNRVGADPVKINDTCIGVFGGIQPEILVSFAKGKIQNGFVDRWLFAFPEKVPYPKFNDIDIDERIAQSWNKIIQRILSLPFEGTPKVVKLSPGAKALYKEWFDNLSDQKNNGGSSFAGLATKMDRYCGRFALVLEVLKFGCKESKLLDISEDSMRGAIALSYYFIACGIKAHRKFISSPVDELPGMQKTIYDELPQSFETRTGLLVAERYGMPERTFKRWLSTSLFRKITHGYYEKRYR